MAAVTDAGDLGLGLATTDAGADTLVGSAGTDVLGLGLAEADVQPGDLATETTTFEPNEVRCRNCAARIVEDFAAYPAEAQRDVVARLVLKETDEKCSIDEIDPAEVKANCDAVLARYEKAANDKDSVQAVDQATSANEQTIRAENIAEEIAVSEDAAEQVGKDQDQKEVADYLDNLGDTLTLNQIEAALAKCNQLEDKSAYFEIHFALTTVKSDLNRVASIAPPDNPQEAAVLRQIVASTPVSWKAPTPAVRYQAIIAAIDAGQLSDDTRRRAKEALVGVRAHNPSIQTGGDVNDVLLNGYGEETYIDENGEIQTRKVPLQPGQEIPVTDNAALTVSDSGQPQLKISTSTGEFHADLPENVTADIMTQTVLTTQLIAQFHDINLAEVMYGRPMQERGGGRIDLRLPEDFNRTKRLMQTLYGGTAGYNGEILQQGDLDRIPYLMQFHSSKGDAMRGDVNPDMMRADLETQGVIENGSINWQRFENMVMANRANMYTAPKDFAQTEKAA